MARYTGPVCRLCRREGIKLFLKGDRCYTGKCAIERRSYVPGQHGQGRRPKVSEYGLHLREKQKARRVYGVLESQFRRYFEQAKRAKGVTGARLLQILESRLDNVVYRLGFGSSRAEARQLVRHGHFNVNGKRVDIPSYLTKIGDAIEVRAESKDQAKFKAIAETLGTRAVPGWLELHPMEMRGYVKASPAREDIDVPVAEHLIVELYSR
jgi:small subunit ribosomal protein S4